MRVGNLLSANLPFPTKASRDSLAGGGEGPEYRMSLREDSRPGFFHGLCMAKLSKTDGISGGGERSSGFST